MIKAIIFDFDDTLEDFSSVKRAAEKRIAKYLHKKLNLISDFFIEHFEKIDLKNSHFGAGKKNLGLFDRHCWFKEFFCLARLKVSSTEVNNLVNMYWEYINKHAKLLPFVKSTLDYLNKKYLLVMMSDSDGSRKIKMERIKNVGLLDRMDFILLGDDVKTNKPNNIFYDLILNKLKIKPDECVMVGDKPEVDLKLAKIRGMKTVWVKHGSWANQLKDETFAYVDHSVNDIRELREIL